MSVLWICTQPIRIVLACPAIYIEQHVIHGLLLNENEEKEIAWHLELFFAAGLKRVSVGSTLPTFFPPQISLSKKARWGFDVTLRLQKKAPTYRPEIYWTQMYKKMNKHNGKQKLKEWIFSAHALYPSYICMIPFTCRAQALIFFHFSFKFRTQTFLMQIWHFCNNIF